MKKINAIGLMSGTSLDGVDLVYVSFKNDDFNIIASKTYNYSSYWLEKLEGISGLAKGSELLKVLDVNLGKYYADLVLEFQDEFAIDDIDFIASHGHTVHHQPDQGYTLQIGSGEEIARVCKKKVVCDFRSQDVELGGQGAPLVPIGDRDLFSNYKYCVNLGGFSNISFDTNGERVAFDICPVNTVLNYYSKKKGVDYDKNGEFAKSGSLHLGLLKELNALDFYCMKAPKSLGVEFVNEQVIPVIEKYRLTIEDVLRTFVEHIAVQIASVIDEGEVLFTGGGAYNGFLMQRINFCLQSIIKLPDNQIIDYKEALVFVYLGKLKIEGKNNCLKSVTGAKTDHCSGVVFNYC